MSNEFKLVPVEPTSEMTFVGQGLRYDPVNSIGEIYRRMLAAAPQPPALGGEPETLAVFKADGSSLHQTKAGFERQLTGLDVELIDRAHIAPLQAEIERHQGEIAGAQAMLETAYAERDQVKARCDEVENLLLDLVTQHDLPIAARNLCNAALSKPAGSEQV